MNPSPYAGYSSPTWNNYADDLVFLPDLNEGDWGKVLAYMDTRPFRRGETIIAINEVDRSLYLVTEGSLEVLIPSNNGMGMRSISNIEAGSVIGEQAFLDGKPRSAMIRATSDGEVLRLTMPAFQALATRETVLAQAILFDLGRILSVRLRQTNALVSSLTS